MNGIEHQVDLPVLFGRSSDCRQLYSIYHLKNNMIISINLFLLQLMAMCCWQLGDWELLQTPREPQRSEDQGH